MIRGGSGATNTNRISEDDEPVAVTRSQRLEPAQLEPGKYHD